MAERQKTQTPPTQTATRQQPQQPWQEKPNQPLAAQPDNGQQKSADREVEYTPLGESQKIKLTVNMVRTLLCNPTKNGHMPPDSEVIKFMMICRQRALNPWVGDAYLLGYETQQHGDKWSIVVAIQALLKRAEINSHFVGIESGVVVLYGDQVIERQGDLTFDGEELVGGWAKVYRDDRKTIFYQRLKLSTYRRRTAIWDSDPAGMICKDAEAAALRQAFPSDVGSLYLEGEMMALLEGAGADQPADRKPASAASQLKERLGATGGPHYQPSASETVVGKAPEKPPEGNQTRQEAPGEHDQTAGTEGQEPTQDATEASQGDDGHGLDGPQEPEGTEEQAKARF